MKTALQLVLSALLFVATYGVFAHGNANGFVSYDDPIYVTDNPDLELGLTAEGVRWSLTSFRGGNWHPITWWTHLLDHELYGLEDPGGHHRTSALLHALAAVLLLWALYRLTDAPWPSLFVAAVFALHPLRVESVTWIAERKDVVAALFFAATLLAWAHYARRPSVLRYLLVLLLFALCLASKSMGVTLPFVLLLLDHWPLDRARERGWGRLALEKLPLLALAAAVCVATYFAQASTGSVGTTAWLPVPERFANAALSYVVYLRQSLWPEGLACFYPHPAVVDPDFALRSGAVLGSLALLLGITLVAWWTRRTRPYLLVGWLAYLGMLVPAIGILQVGAQGHADRYTYLPGIGLAIAIAWLGADLARGSRPARRALLVVSVVAVALLARRTWRQIETWRDSETLYEHAVAVTERNYVALNNLGLLLEQRGEVEEAEALYREALAHRPGFPDASANLAKRHLLRGELEPAAEVLETALANDPDHVPSLANLGALEIERGDHGEARRILEQVLTLDPYHEESLRNLMSLYRLADNVAATLPYLERLLERRPADLGLRLARGEALAALERFDEARAALEGVLAAQADEAESARALRALADLEVERGDVERGMADLERLLALQPEDAAAALALADLSLEHAADEALAARLRRAVELAPEAAHYRNRLAWLLAWSEEEAVRDRGAAVALARESVELTEQTDLDSLTTLAATLAASGDLGKAAWWQRKAIAIAPDVLVPQLEEDLARIDANRPPGARRRAPREGGKRDGGRRRDS